MADVSDVEPFFGVKKTIEKIHTYSIIMLPKGVLPL